MIRESLLKRSRINRQQIFVNTAFAAGGVCVALVMLEVFLRLWGYSAPVFRLPDLQHGWLLTPNARGVARKEVDNYVVLNRAGFHDYERNKNKQLGVYRIAILGDSFVQGTEVPKEYLFSSKLEAQLNTAGLQSRYEVLNFGVVGYGTTQEYLLLESKVWGYKPDLIILAVFIGNDVADNYYKTAESLKDQRPYFSLNEDGVLTRVQGYPSRIVTLRDTTFFSLINASNAIQLSKELALRILGRRSAHSHDPIKHRITYKDNVYQPTPDRDWVYAWKLTEALLRKMSTTVIKRDKKFLILLLPEAIAVDQRRELRQDFEAGIKVSDLFYPNRRLRDFASENDIALIDVTEEMRKRAADSKMFLHGFSKASFDTGHLNKKGHQVVAELLKMELVKIIPEVVENIQ